MRTIFLVVLTLLFTLPFAQSQEKKDTLLKSSTFSGLAFRNIGPALTSGRIADIAIHPHNENIMYVAVGSGGVWKTVNAGTTWTPIFDKQKSYSIGCVTIDSRDPSIIWVGTGENVGGRHVGFGDGIYKSVDGGKTWKNMGLKDFEHISKIIVHPDNSNKIYVAVQGPLWSKGGERGLYISDDGGGTWNKVLGDDEWVGVTDIVMDPNNPMKLIVATWQRHRNVAAYMGGGPGSGLHRSVDGGQTWQKLTSGLPMMNMGKIGLAISPQSSNRIYAAIEEIRTKGGLYMSVDGGSSWNKQSDMVSGGTGPHYYQELYADPHHEGRLYLMNNVVLISDDHGRTYRQMNESKKHVDTHAMGFRKNDPNYVIMGTDGGLFESFDQTKTWRYVRNLPLTQFYKVAVDDALPFYNVYGGTQDNGSQGGPSRTKSSAGIWNRDWRVVLGADGHQSATEPGNPDITYGEFQEGWLFRIDHKTGESVFIQPQPAAGDPHERFNWDAPILVSPHDPKRIYFASYRVWRSDNRGDDWTAISGDLTRNQERLALPIMGQEQSWDNAWDVNAMSNYNTITSLAESPLLDGLIYAGTDDGIIQVTEDGGANWTKLEAGQIDGIPETAFVNDIRADLFDVNVVYACLDNHKYGDFKPYMIKSMDRGKTWASITGDLPERNLVWRMVQDHVNANLVFAATEFGVYFTVDGGEKWVKLSAGMPTISLRDITIQRRENDLVAASFGRGFYILDDYSALRNMSEETLQNEAILFDTKTAYWYRPLDEIYGQGNSEYAAKNPPFGATFTYYLKDKLKSLKDVRTEEEKKLTKDKKAIPFPGWDALDEEMAQEAPAIYLTVTDAAGNVVKQVKGKNAKGISRVSWDLGTSSKNIVRLNPPSGSGGFFFGGGTKATPGTYFVTLSKLVDGEWTDLAGPKKFEVAPLQESTLPRASYEDMIAFRNQYQQFQKDLTATNMKLAKGVKRVKAISTALSRADRQPASLISGLYGAHNELKVLDRLLNGSKAKSEIGERDDPSPGNGLFIGIIAMNATHGPTGNHKAALNRAVEQLAELSSSIQVVLDRIPDLEAQAVAAGAPEVESN